MNEIAFEYFLSTPQVYIIIQNIKLYFFIIYLVYLSFYKNKLEIITCNLFI